MLCGIKNLPAFQLIIILIKVKNLRLVAYQLIIELPHKVSKCNNRNILKNWMWTLNKLQNELNIVFKTLLTQTHVFK
jgi:hypothetical protein